MTWLLHRDKDPENNEYGTPPDLWRPLSRAVGGFDLDPCSGAEPEPIADTRYTKDDDGLTQPWFGHVFANIPWSTNGNGSAKDVWFTKIRNEARREAVESITVIVSGDTSTGWFHDHVCAAPVVAFFGPGRVSFVGGDRNPSFGLIVPVYGDPPQDLVDVLASKGTVFHGRAHYDPAPQSTLTLGEEVRPESGGVGE